MTLQLQLPVSPQLQLVLELAPRQLPRASQQRDGERGGDSAEPPRGLPPPLRPSPLRPMHPGKSCQRTFVKFHSAW